MNCLILLPRVLSNGTQLPPIPQPPSPATTNYVVFPQSDKCGEKVTMRGLSLIPSLPEESAVTRPPLSPSFLFPPHCEDLQARRSSERVLIFMSSETCFSITNPLPRLINSSHLFPSFSSYFNVPSLFKTVPEIGVLHVGPCILRIYAFVSIGI